jgi:MGT family glycosyltransferase
MAVLILEDAPDALRGARVDALIVDQNEPAGATVAEYMKLPFVSACTSLPLNREPLIPPPFTGWTYADSTFARARNRIGYGIADALIRPIHGTMNQYRRQWGLRPLATPDDSFSRSAEVAQMPREFDFPRANLPATFHYCGPWFDGSSLRSEFPFERLDGRPLIYGSLGTLQRKDSEHFRTIAAACAGLDVQLVLSLGPHEGPAPDLPGDPVVVDYAPQLKLLSRAALAITHAGMNTTQQALHYGVPLVAIPLAHDQPAIASRLARTGAGIVIRPRGLSVEALRNAIRKVMPANSSYRWNAERLRAASEKAGGVERAAGIAEAALSRGYGRGASG